MWLGICQLSGFVEHKCARLAGWCIKHGAGVMGWSVHVRWFDIWQYGLQLDIGSIWTQESIDSIGFAKCGNL